VRPSSRLLAVLACLLLVVSACGAAATMPAGAAATVDGDTISRDQLEEAVRELSTDLPSDGRTEAVEQLQRQVLTLLVQARIIEHLADDQGVDYDEAEAQERIEADIAEAGGEEAFAELLAFQDFTLDLYRDVLVPIQLRVDVMRARLADEAPPLEQRAVRHILVETEEEADEVVDELAAGVDFGELAEDRSIDPGSAAQGGELGTTERGRFVPEFDEAAFEAEVDEIVGPVETQFGFHVIQVTDVQETPASELDLQQQDQVVGAELGAMISEAFASAEIEVDPAFGRWDTDQQQVVPGDRVGEGDPAPDQPGLGEELQPLDPEGPDELGEEPEDGTGTDEG
jgi:peptidyl-prolyl cis-trans isomerase C